MLELAEFISGAGALAGFSALALIPFACWKLHMLKRSRLLLSAAVVSAAAFVHCCLFQLPWFLMNVFPGLWDLYLPLNQNESLWSALSYLGIFLDLALTLALARWFFLRYQQQISAPDRFLPTE